MTYTLLVKKLENISDIIEKYKNKDDGDEEDYYLEYLIGIKKDIESKLTPYNIKNIVKIYKKLKEKLPIDCIYYISSFGTLEYINAFEHLINENAFL